MGHGCHDCGCPNGCVCGQPTEEEVLSKQIENDSGVRTARKAVADAQAELQAELHRALYAARASVSLDREIEEAEQRLTALRRRRK